jgi:hypothetical protein
VSVHKHRNFSRKGAKTPRKKYNMPFELYDFNFAIFASWRELFFLDEH